jgi:hypothetical protein
MYILQVIRAFRDRASRERPPPFLRHPAAPFP